MHHTNISNPYLSNDDKPLLRRSIVAFVDILGYKDSVVRSRIH